jgi:PAS domain S-box-containing protein
MNNPLHHSHRKGLIDTLFSTERDYLQLYRLLLLTAGVLYVFFGILNHQLNYEGITLFIQRITLGGVWLTAMILSYFRQSVRKRLQPIVYISSYIIMAHLVYVAVIKNFPLSSLTALITTVFIGSTAFKKTKHLHYFIAFSLIAISLAIYATRYEAIDRFTLISSFLIAGLFTLVVLDTRLHIHEKLNDSEALFKELFDKSADSLFIVAPHQLTILDCNYRACKTFGFINKEELLNSPAHLFQRQPLSEQELAEIEDSIANQQAWSKSQQFITTHGKIFWGDLAIRSIIISKKPYYLYRVSDITKQREEQEHIRLLESVAVNVRDAVMITEAAPLEEPGPKITYVNKAFTEMTGYSYEESIGRSPRFLQGPASDRHELDNIKQCLYNQSPCDAELINYKKDGSIFWVNFSIAPVKDDTGQLTHFVSVQRDTTERKRTLEKLASSELRYRTLIEHSSEIIFSLTLEGDFTYVSNNWQHILGHSPEEIVGKSLADVVHKDDLQICLYYLKQVLHAEANGHWIEYRIRHKNGIWIWHTSSVAMVRNDKGRPSFFVGVCHDLSKRKQEEDLLKASLHEKEVLLKEIHHRVKNNMTVISSLLSMQSNYIQDEQSKLLFKESQNRIRSMALIHDKLYQHESLANIEFGNYISDLVRDIKRSYNHQTAFIHIDLQVDTVFMEIGKAIPCGLIINEIFSNAYKHAFKGMEEGRIQISFSKTDDIYTLIVKDNGIGLPEGFDINTSPTLGMQLITALVEQIHGTLEIKQNNGTTFKVSFKE